MYLRHPLTDTVPILSAKYGKIHRLINSQNVRQVSIDVFADTWPTVSVTISVDSVSVNI